LCLKSWNLPFAVNTKECKQMELFCIIPMLDLVWQQQPLKQFKDWHQNFFPIQHTVQILLPSDYHIFWLIKDVLHGLPQNIVCVHAQLCSNQKCSLWMASGSSWTEVTNVEKLGDYRLCICSCVSFVE
jgi:hypothetical protein